MQLPDTKRVSYLPPSVRRTLAFANTILVGAGLAVIAARYKPVPDRISEPPVVVAAVKDDKTEVRAKVKEQAEALEAKGKLYEAAKVYTNYCDETGDCGFLTDANRLANSLIGKNDGQVREIQDYLKRKGLVLIPVTPGRVEDFGGPTARQAAQFRLEASNAEKSGDLALAARKYFAAGTSFDKAQAAELADRFAGEAQAEADLVQKVGKLQKAIDTYRAIGAGEKAAGLEIILNELKKSPEYLEKIGKKLEAAYAYLDKNDAGSANRLRNELAGKAKTRKDRRDIAGLDARLSKLGVVIPIQPWRIDEAGRAERSAEDQRRSDQAAKERVERRAKEDAARRAEARRQEEAKPFDKADYISINAKPVYTRPLALLITRYRNEGKFGDADSITITFTIGTDGRVKDASAELSGGELPSGFQVEFEATLARLRFPAPKEEVDIRLNPRLK